VDHTSGDNKSLPRGHYARCLPRHQQGRLTLQNVTYFIARVVMPPCSRTWRNFHTCNDSFPVSYGHVRFGNDDPTKPGSLRITNSRNQKATESNARTLKNSKHIGLSNEMVVKQRNQVQGYGVTQQCGFFYP
jgi:hypothetical protein